MAKYATWRIEQEGAEFDVRLGRRRVRIFYELDEAIAFVVGQLGPHDRALLVEPDGYETRLRINSHTRGSR